MRHASDDCISKPVILKLKTLPGHTGLRASVSRGSGVLLSPRPWSVRDDGTVAGASLASLQTPTILMLVFEKGGDVL